MFCWIVYIDCLACLVGCWTVRFGVSGALCGLCWVDCGGSCFWVVVCFWVGCGGLSCLLGCYVLVGLFD